MRLLAEGIAKRSVGDSARAATPPEGTVSHALADKVRDSRALVGSLRHLSLIPVFWILLHGNCAVAPAPRAPVVNVVAPSRAVTALPPQPLEPEFLGTTSTPKYPQSVFNVSQLSEIQTTAGLCHAIILSYHIPISARVYLHGLGAFPSIAELRFTSCDSGLWIRDSPNGSLLAFIPFSQATQFMGDDIVPLPTPTDFGQAYEEGTFSGTKTSTFAARVLAVLQDQFGLVSAHRIGSESRLVTTYADINDDHTVRVAVMVAYPPEETDKMTFRIWVRAQERRSLTGWRDQPLSDKAIGLSLARVSELRKVLSFSQ